MRVAVIGCMFGYRIDDKRNVTIISANINTDNEPSVLEILVLQSARVFLKRFWFFSYLNPPCSYCTYKFANWQLN